MCVYVWVCACACSTCGGQKEALEPHELELRTVMIYLLWVLGTEYRTSRRVTIAINH